VAFEDGGGVEEGIDLGVGEVVADVVVGGEGAAFGIGGSLEYAGIPLSE